jgi:hypothetical protein
MVLEKSVLGGENELMNEERQRGATAGLSEEELDEGLQEDMARDAAEFSEGPLAWSHYYLYTMADGSIEGRCETNDDGDTGYPGRYEEWEVQYRDKASMLKQLSGGSHVGWMGGRVEVYLDGEMIGEQLAPLHEGI